MDIRVYHYQSGASDKVWAIDIDPRDSHPDQHRVWYGRRGSKLTSKLLLGDPFDRIRDKENKGYLLRPDLTINEETNRTAHFNRNSNDEVEEVVEADRFLYYRFLSPKTSIAKTLLIKTVSHYLNDVKTALEDEHRAFLAGFIGSECYQSLMKLEQDFLLSNDINYKDGPLAALMLFGLSRRLVDLNLDDIGLTVVTDRNIHIPVEFQNIDSLLNDLGEAYYGEFSQKKFDNYQSLGIAFGCIDAPVNFSEIVSETQAAFF